METMHHTSHTPPAQVAQEPKYNKHAARQEETRWLEETAGHAAKLDSEVIPDSEYYKRFIPAIKTTFKEMFGFEPKVKYGFIVELHQFLQRHHDLKTETNEDTKTLASYSRGLIQSWVIREISHNTYKSDATAEYEAEVDRQIDVAVAKMDQFYAWLFKNVTIKPETK